MTSHIPNPSTTRNSRNSNEHRDEAMASSSTQLTTNGNMAAVAARIQERALQLQSERVKWDLTKAELEQVESIAADERHVNHSTRRTLLATTRSRHGVEMELYEAQDQAQDCMQSIECLEQKKESIVEQTENIRCQWGDAVRTTYAPHQLDMEVYRASLEKSVREREERSSQRKKKLDDIEAQVAQLDRRKAQLEDESKDLKRGISELESKEEEDDREVSSLATKVRELLAKRTRLRGSLRNAQDARRKANEDMLKWENECIALSNRALP